MTTRPLPLLRVFFLVLLFGTQLSWAIPTSRPAETPVTIDPASKWLLLDAVSAQDFLLTVGERGVILRSSDQGRSWLRSPTPTKEALTCLAYSAQTNRLFTAGHGGKILVSEDLGLSWKFCYEAPSLETSFLHIACFSKNKILAVGAFGIAYQSIDSGDTWAVLPLPTEDQHLNHIEQLIDDSIVITGERGLVLHSTDEGASWNILRVPYEGSFFKALNVDSNKWIVHGLRGHVFSTSVDKPSAWSEIKTPTQGLLACSLKLPSGAILLAGQARSFALSRDGALSFQPWQSGLNTAVSALLFTKDGRLLAFGEAGISELPLP